MIVFGFFFKKKNGGRAKPSHLDWAKTGPAQMQLNYSAATCRNEFFCIQLPQRKRRRQRREEKIAWLRGLRRAEDVWTVSQKASAEVMVAEVGCERKKKRLQRREKGWKEKRESRGGSLVLGWWLCWLLMVELVVAGMAGREKERKSCRNRAERLVFGRLWTRFSPSSDHQIYLYL